MPTVSKNSNISSLEDPQNFTFKHKLNHKWTLWYDDPALAKANPKENWEDNLKKIATFESVEDFWGLLNNLKKPSEIPTGSNYHLFKDGIKPMWEVEENKMGGKWTFVQDKRKRGPELNFCWMHTMLKMIGEQFTNNEDIRGAVVSVRKGGDRISLWTGSFNDAKKTIAIGDASTFNGKAFVLYPQGYFSKDKQHRSDKVFMLNICLVIKWYPKNNEVLKGEDIYCVYYGSVDNINIEVKKKGFYPSISTQS